jgi:hypothetical protein
MQYDNMLEAALWYAERGYNVFPCASGDKEPITKDGFHNATADVAQIESWWAERPSANIGIPTAGLLVLDIDREAEWLADDVDKQLELAIAPLARTGGGGRHFVFRQPDGTNWRNTTGGLAPHVDTRADGGYFVVPPSALPGHRDYGWAHEMELDVAPENLPEPPAWLVEQLDALATSGDTSARVATGDAEANKIPQGQRNATLAKLAGTMRRVGMSQAEIVVALRQVSADRCHPPLDDTEIERIAGSVARYEPDQISVAVIENHWEQMQTNEASAEFEFEAVTSRELATSDYSLEYLIDGVLVRGQPMMIGGPKKSLKTNSSIDLALSLGHGGLFLGRFDVPEAVRVGVMTAESGAATIQETANRIAWEKNWSLENFDNVVWAFDVPQLNLPKHMAALRRFLEQNELEVVILDPTYMMMLGLGSDAGNLFVVGEFLKSISDLIRDTGCTPILCHHLKKSVAEPFEPAELDSIAWAGFGEFVRQWILLNRRVKYDPDNGGHHEIWMSVGGSVGHSGQWGVNVDEGTPQDEGGRRWEVELMSTSQAYAERAALEENVTERRKQRQQESRDERQQKAILTALGSFPEGETPRVIREAASVSGAVLNVHLPRLMESGLVTECTVKKNTREERAFRLAQGGGTGGTVPPVPARSGGGGTALYI